MDQRAAYLCGQGFKTIRKPRSRTGCQNVTPNTKAPGPAETWRLEEGFSRITPISDIVLVGFWTSIWKTDKGYRMHGLFAQLAEAVKALEGDFSWFIYEKRILAGQAGPATLPSPPIIPLGNRGQNDQPQRKYHGKNLRQGTRRRRF
ncbi:MAG: hypothetical protein R2788_01875 [Saprospiraceae bacterium]